MADEELDEIKDKELEAQTPEAEELSEEGGASKFKNIAIIAGLVLVVVGSFWLSFQLGRKILFPGGGETERKIEVPIPEAPASIKPLPKTSPEAEKPEEKVIAPRRAGYYKVQAGLYVDRAKAEALEAELNEQGIDTYLKKTATGWRVQVGAFKTKSEANAMKAALRAKGFKARILFE